MAITAADIHNQSFSIDRKGYDVDEVDVFLERVADEIDILNNQVDSLEAQLDQLSLDSLEQDGSHMADESPSAAKTAFIDMGAATANADYDAIIAEKDARIADLERQLEEKRADDNAISQALIIAQRSADEIIANANAQAADTIEDARDEATRILNRANSDKQAVVDSIRKLEDDRENTREEYQDILKDFITDASRKLADIGGVLPENDAPASLPASDNKPNAQETGEFDIDDFDDADLALDYSTPQTGDVAVAAVTPKASAFEKDLSGFGDADDFGFEEVD